MSTRHVYELAAEFGVESKWVLDRMKELGDILRSASSPVPFEAETRFRCAYGEQLSAGVSPADISPAVANPEAVARAEQFRDSVMKNARSRRRSHGGHRGIPTRAEREAQKPRRQTSWDKSGLDASAERVWREAGLGDDHAELALFLAKNGIRPEDLKLMVRGRSAVSRLRGGEESRHVLAKEIKRIRSEAPAKLRELPSTAVVRRWQTN